MYRGLVGRLFVLLLVLSSDPRVRVYRGVCLCAESIEHDEELLRFEDFLVNYPHFPDINTDIHIDEADMDKWIDLTPCTCLHRCRLMRAAVREIL